VPDLTNQTYVYIVRAEANDNGLGVAISNPLTIIKQPNIFYPAAFSPNSDGLNDKFIVFGQFVSIFEMKIFNRWGELMFSTDALNDGWDGNYKGIAMPEGTYAFVANLTDTEGRTFKRSGSVVLLRKK
jgi:gliding motility-associated-like protein